ncbi:hypothetical protein [Microbacterium sp. NPDC087665]|uniref:hypothetical protein n=1 Tax=Microbacterium sp. NPDC087665 TaxID=3364194 RepID=UPI00382F42A3
MEDRELSQAIIAFLGSGRTAWPASDESAVVACAVETDPTVLLGRVRAIIGECLSVPVDGSGISLTEGGDLARKAMALRHPELTVEALDELRWMFTYNWK